MPLPDKIANAPVIDPSNQLYFDAFEDLSTCRLYAGGPIPALALFQYGEYNGLDKEQLDRVIEVVKRVDAWYLDFMEKRDKAKQKANTPKTKHKGK